MLARFTRARTRKHRFIEVETYIDNVILLKDQQGLSGRRAMRRVAVSYVPVRDHEIADIETDIHAVDDLEKTLQIGQYAVIGSAGDVRLSLSGHGDSPRQ